ncbi:MAG: hypothetical protein V4494_04225 [Chlamydiota bacterium]
MRLCLLAFLCVASLSGCYQAHSDDNLRTVPVTNNPLLIQDSQKVAGFPGAGY